MRQFNLYRRGKTYYCRFKNPDTGSWLSGISTGETEESAALATVYGLEKHGIPSRGDRSVSSVVSVRTIIDQLKTAELRSGSVPASGVTLSLHQLLHARPLFLQ